MTNAALKLPEMPQDLFPEFPTSLPPPPAEFLALKASLSQVAPGVWVSGLPAFEVPSHVLCKLVPGEKPGTFLLEPEAYPGYIRMSGDIGQQLGVLGLSEMTMRRLLYHGYVSHIRPSPSCIFISLESLHEHFQNTANDCEREQSFWTPRRMAEWRSTYESPNT